MFANGGAKVLLLVLIVVQLVFFHHSLTTRSDNSKASRHEACSFNPFLTQPALLFKLKQHSAVVVGFLLLRVGSLKIRTATI